MNNFDDIFGGKKKKELEVKIVKENGKRYILKGKKKYPIESKLSNREILLNITEILKEIVQREKKAKKEKKKQGKEPAPARVRQSRGRSYSTRQPKQQQQAQQQAQQDDQQRFQRFNQYKVQDEIKALEKKNEDIQKKANETLAKFIGLKANVATEGNEKIEREDINKIMAELFKEREEIDKELAEKKGVLQETERNITIQEKTLQGLVTNITKLEKQLQDLKNDTFYSNIEKRDLQKQTKELTENYKKLQEEAKKAFQIMETLRSKGRAYLSHVETLENYQKSVNKHISELDGILKQNVRQLQVQLYIEEGEKDLLTTHKNKNKELVLRLNKMFDIPKKNADLDKQIEDLEKKRQTKEIKDKIANLQSQQIRLSDTTPPKTLLNQLKQITDKDTYENTIIQYVKEEEINKKPYFREKLAIIFPPELKEDRTKLKEKALKPLDKGELEKFKAELEETPNIGTLLDDANLPDVQVDELPYFNVDISNPKTMVPKPPTTPSKGLADVLDDIGSPMASIPTTPQAPKKTKPEDGKDIPENPDVGSSSTGSGNMNDAKEKIGLTDTQINKIMGQEMPKHGFIAVIARDEIMELPKVSKNKFAFIMNTDDRGESDMGHWVSVVIDKNRNIVEYYDSLGEEPDEDFEKDIKKYLKKLGLDKGLYQLKINRVQKQSDKSDTCGYFAMKFLSDRLVKDKNFMEATGFGIIKDAIKGEKDIKRFKQKIDEFGYLKLT